MRTIPRRARRRAVGRHGHEVDLVGDRDGAHQVAQEDERALQHGDEERRPPLVVRRDLPPELRDAVVQLLGGDQDLAGPGLGHSIGRGVGAHGRARLPRCRPVDRTGHEAEALLAALDPQAGRDLARPALAAGDGQDPLDGRPVRRVLAGQPTPHGPAGQRHRSGREGTRRRWGRGRPRARRRGRPRRGAPRPGGRAPGRRRARRWRRAGGGARGAPGCGGRRATSLDGSSTGRRPRSAHSARVSLRRRPSSGRRADRMPASPSSPAPRRRLSSTVSAWSSAVWPVRTSAGRTA